MNKGFLIEVLIFVLHLIWVGIYFVYIKYKQALGRRSYKMLKKLAKYGNSTTLVIDKAILELLNMDESSIVKLQTDGRSLIITPASSLDKDKISYSSDEAFQVAIKTEVAKQLERSIINQAKTEELMPQVQEDFQKVFKRNKESLAKATENIMGNQEFQEAFALLAQKYDPITQSEDYLRELQELKTQFLPELSELSKEITGIAKKYDNQI